MLVASFVGLDTRATKDIDTTVQSLPLTLEYLTNIINEIIHINLDDGVIFNITQSSNIMEEHEHPGLRFILDAYLDRIKQQIKIDISTGDIITPAAIEYSYQLMFKKKIDIYFKL